MRILVNENNEIVNYVTVGSVSMEGHETIEVTEEKVPELFFDLYKPKLFLYENETIIVNDDYIEEEDFIENNDKMIERIIERQQIEIDYLYEYHQLAKPDI